MANRIGDTLRQIEQTAKTSMRKDNLSSIADEESTPDIEIPGTKLGLKTVIDIGRSIFGIYPKHISGDIVFPVTLSTSAESRSGKNNVTVTIHVAQGRNRSPAISVVMAGDDVDIIVQRTAETILAQVNPYVLAVYRYDRHEYEKASELIQQVIQNPSSGRPYKAAAFILWSALLNLEENYDDAIAKCKEAVELDPKNALAYVNWGNALEGEWLPDEAIAKYQRSIEIDPKHTPAYLNWGVLLDREGLHDEAIVKYQRSIEIDPKNALACFNWGASLENERKHDEAIAKYQKAIELDPKYASAYGYWGASLEREGKHDEAIAKYTEAIRYQPDNAGFFYSRAFVLAGKGLFGSAIADFQKYLDLGGGARAGNTENVKEMIRDLESKKR